MSEKGYFAQFINGHTIKGESWRAKDGKWHGRVTVDGEEKRSAVADEQSDIVSWCVDAVLELGGEVEA